MATTNTNFKVKNGLDAVGDISTNGWLYSNASAGDEGGQIVLEKPVTNTTLASPVVIDIYQNKIRFFEYGGTNRGYYIDLTSGSGGAGTNLVASGGGTTTNSLTVGTVGLKMTTGTSPWNGSAAATIDIDNTKVALLNSPSFTTPTLGAASATSINKVTITAPATGATFTLTNLKTFAVQNSLTLAGTDNTTMTFPSTSATIARTDAAQTFTGIQTMTSPSITTSLTTSTVGTFSLVDTNATTINFASAATTMNIATGNVAKTINIGTGGSGGNAAIVNIGTGASATSSTTYINGDLYIGKSVSGTGTQTGYSATMSLQAVTATGSTGAATAQPFYFYGPGASTSNTLNANTATGGGLYIYGGSASTNSTGSGNATGGNLYLYSGPASIANGGTGTATSGNIIIDVGTANPGVNGGNVNGTITIGATAASITTGSATTTVINTGDKPILKTSSFTVGAGEKNFNVTGTASVTVTLPTATAGRTINIVNKAAFTIVSASSNVYPRTSNTLGTSICAASAGSWATLVADGTNWYIMAGG